MAKYHPFMVSLGMVDPIALLTLVGMGWSDPYFWDGLKHQPDLD